MVALYDCLARLASVALQHGAPVETDGKLLKGVKVEPAGIVTGQPAGRHWATPLESAPRPVPPEPQGAMTYCEGAAGG